MTRTDPAHTHTHTHTSTFCCRNTRGAFRKAKRRKYQKAAVSLAVSPLASSLEAIRPHKKELMGFCHPRRPFVFHWRYPPAPPPPAVNTGVATSMGRSERQSKTLAYIVACVQVAREQPQYRDALVSAVAFDGKRVGGASAQWR